MTISAIATVPNRPTGTQPRAISDILGDFDHITNYLNNTVVPAVNAGQPSDTDTLQQGVISGATPTRDSLTQVTIPAGIGYVLMPTGLLSRVVWSTTVISAIPAGVANGRVDQFVVDGATGVVTRLAGTNAGAAIVNLDDANATASRTALTAGTMRLAEAVVDATGVVGTAGTKFRDRRAFSNGAAWRSTVITTGGNRTTSSATPSAIDALLTQRIECVGRPLRVSLQGTFLGPSGGVPFFGVFIDGVLAEATGTGGLQSGTSNAFGPMPSMVISPSAGSHLIAPCWCTGSAVITTITVSTASPLSCYMEELRPSVGNGAL